MEWTSLQNRKNIPRMKQTQLVMWVSFTQFKYADRMKVHWVLPSARQF